MARGAELPGQTRLLVCIDPSHAVGRADPAPDGISDLFHTVGQGIIVGASMVLIDFHPHPEEALCDMPGGSAGVVESLCRMGEGFVSVVDLDRAMDLDAGA